MQSLQSLVDGIALNGPAIPLGRAFHSYAPREYTLNSEVYRGGNDCDDCSDCSECNCDCSQDNDCCETSAECEN